MKQQDLYLIDVRSSREHYERETNYWVNPVVVTTRDTRELELGINGRNVLIMLEREVLTPYQVIVDSESGTTEPLIEKDIQAPARFGLTIRYSMDTTSSTGWNTGELPVTPEILSFLSRIESAKPHRRVRSGLPKELKGILFDCTLAVAHSA